MKLHFFLSVFIIFEFNLWVKGLRSHSVNKYKILCHPLHLTSNERGFRLLLEERMKKYIAFLQP